jgi:hypothetical protein
MAYLDEYISSPGFRISSKINRLDFRRLLEEGIEERDFGEVR